jgi:hypothetical protein
MKIKSIKAAGNADVYNMEVEGTHDFTVNGGVIAHNCYDELRYVCMANPIAPRPQTARKIKSYSPLDAEVTYDRSYDFYRRY